MYRGPLTNSSGSGIGGQEDEPLLVEERTGIPLPHVGGRVESKLISDTATEIVGALVATETGSASVANATGNVGLLVLQDLSHPALQPPLELCIQRRLLLQMPAEEMTRSIRWSADWQRAGRVTQGRVILSR